MRTSRKLMPIDLIRAYKAMRLDKKRELYSLFREYLNYNDNPDNSNIRKMLRGDRFVPPELIEKLRLHLKQVQPKTLQMDLLDIV